MFMAAYERFLSEIEVVQKRARADGQPLSWAEAATVVNGVQPGLYAEARKTAPAVPITKADHGPQIPVAERGPWQRIVRELCKMEIAAGHARTETEALTRIRSKYPDAVRLASEEAWLQAPGRT